MQKTQESLLILINEERTASEEFILRRLMLLNVDALTKLDLVGSTGRTVLDEIRQASLRFAASSRAGKVIGIIYASTMEGYARLVKQCNLAASQK